jgi:hypothetical protein
LEQSIFDFILSKKISLVKEIIIRNTFFWIHCSMFLNTQIKFLLPKNITT